MRRIHGPDGDPMSAYDAEVEANPGASLAVWTVDGDDVFASTSRDDPTSGPDALSAGVDAYQTKWGRYPLLYVHVTTPRDQAELHRYLAGLGYVPEQLAALPSGDYWRFVHPDGDQPSPQSVVRL